MHAVVDMSEVIRHPDGSIKFILVKEINIDLALVLGAMRHVFSKASHNNNLSNKRIHVSFFHGGTVLEDDRWDNHPMLPLVDSKQCTEKVVAAVWSQFGTVTDTFYHREMAYGFVFFSSHDEAAAAIEALQDYGRHKEIVAAAVATFPDVASEHQLTTADAQLIADRVFTERGEALLRSSWAFARKRKSPD